MSKSIEEGKLISIADFKARRNFLRLSAVVGTGFLFSSCSGPTRPADNSPVATITPGSNNDEDQDNDNVGAVEDLMREHGVLRRALLVYDFSARKLRSKPADLPPDALQNTAKLFRVFGEDYHETKLEEAFIFPAVKKTEGPATTLVDILPATTLVDILLVQHQRGREITDYILSTTQGTKFSAANSEQLAKALDSFVLMYQHHTAREDTILFPAWKKTMTDDELDDMGDKFEEIERQQFGGDGFDDAVKQIGDIETEVGIADISQFTPPPMVKSDK